MSARRPWVRPMTGWWRRNPYFVEYMVHEGTALFVAAYALVLLASVFVLGAGEDAWNRWLALLRHPASVAGHVLLIAAFAYHTWTWFNIMPRTLPPLRVRGARVSAWTITAAGLATALVASAALFTFVAMIAR